MKHLLALLAFILALPLFAVETFTETVDGIEWTYTVYGGKATIYKGSHLSAIPNTTSGDITIPEQLGGADVTSVGGSAFYGCSSLRSVTIPESVTLIEHSAFNGCSSLESVTIPEGVTTIGGSAFYRCSSLRSVTIPEGVTSIGERAFEDCSSLTSVTIPESVTLIDSFAFDGCSSLESVTIPEGVTTIGGFAFYGCRSLESLTIPESVTLIEHSAFYGCSSLRSVTIPEGVTSIGERAFEECSSLTSVTIPDSVTSIRERAFYGCISLSSLTIPESVTSIGTWAFAGSTLLTSINIPHGVTSLGTGIFSNCHSLTSVTIPEGVTSIGDSAFYGCRSLESLTIPESVTSIGNDAFYGCKYVYLYCAPAEKAWEIGGENLYYAKEHAAAWEAVFGESRRGSLVDVVLSAKITVSATMTTPKTMKVTYTVKSDLETVKVRAVAFKDGVRSFANLVPVTQGENVPKGGSVATNTEHTFTWQVDADWDTDLDKVAVEILVQEGTLLPQELLTIPANGDHAAMTITRNALDETMLFNALLWCMAEGDSALTNTNGVVKANGVQIASNASISTYGTNATALLNYLYGKMGYKVLAGEDYTYAKAATRIAFANSGTRQVAVKIEDQTSTEE